MVFYCWQRMRMLWEEASDSIAMLVGTHDSMHLSMCSVTREQPGCYIIMNTIIFGVLIMLPA